MLGTLSVIATVALAGILDDPALRFDYSDDIAVDLIAESITDIGGGELRVELRVEATNVSQTRRFHRIDVAFPDALTPPPWMEILDDTATVRDLEPQQTQVSEDTLVLTVPTARRASLARSLRRFDGWSVVGIELATFGPAVISYDRDTDRLVDVSSPGALHFSEPTPWLEALQPGDIVVHADENLAEPWPLRETPPHVFPLEVVTAGPDTLGTGFDVTFTSPNAEDVVVNGLYVMNLGRDGLDGTIGSQVPDDLYQATLACEEDPATDGGDCTYKGVPFRFDIALQQNLRLQGQLNLGIAESRIAFQIEDGKVVGGVLGIGVHESLSLDLLAEGDITVPPREQTIGIPITLPITTTVPGSLTLEIAMVVGAEGAAQSGTTLGIQQAADAQLWMEWDAAGVRFDADASAEPIDFTPPVILDSTSATVTGWAALDVALMLDSVVGTTARVKPWVRLDVQPTEPEWWSVDTGLAMEGSLDLAFWNIGLTGDSGELTTAATGWGAAPWGGPGTPREGDETRWSWTYSDAEQWDYDAQSLAATADGNLVLSTRQSTSDTGGVLMRLNAKGHNQWSQRFSTLSQSYWAPLADGRTLVAGSLGNFDLFIAEIDAGGTLLWHRIFDAGFWAVDDLAVSVVTAGGGAEYVLLTGTTSLNRGLGVLFTTTGDVVWSKAYTHADGSAVQLKASAQLDGGDVVLGGSTYGGLPLCDGNTSNDMLLLRARPEDGVPVWAKQMGTCFSDEIRGLTRAPGGVAAVGHQWAQTLTTKSSWAGLVSADGSSIEAKTWSENLEWDQEFHGDVPDPATGDTTTDFAHDIVAVDGGFVVVGHTGQLTAQEAWVIGTGPDLTPRWWTRMGGVDADHLTHAAATVDGVVVLGDSESLNAAGPGELDTWISHIPFNGAMRLGQGAASGFRSPHVVPANDAVMDISGEILATDIALTEMPSSVQLEPVDVERRLHHLRF